MLNFASNEQIESGEINYNFDYAAPTVARKTNPVKMLAEKISLPVLEAQVERQRLFTHLEQSLTQFSSTLITGRVGTGKTALALDFAKQKNDAVAWYKIETSDSDWKVFLGYLTQSLQKFQIDDLSAKQNENFFAEIENLPVTDALAVLFSTVEAEKPLLVVLDDLHSVYDTEWFAEFFNALLSLPTSNVRLLMLARSAPPFPLWRLRSKHVLDVVDEKLLAFTAPETIEFFQSYGLSEKAARASHKSAYGKVAKLKEIAEKKVA